MATGERAADPLRPDRRRRREPRRRCRRRQRVRPADVSRYTGLPSSEPSDNADGVSPSGGGGETRIDAGAIAGSRASRSIGSSAGMRAYIITMPETNQTMKSRPPAMPSQRCVYTSMRAARWPLTLLHVLPVADLALGHPLDGRFDPLLARGRLLGLENPG